MHSLLRIVFISLLAAQSTPNTVLAQVKAVPPLSGVIGKVQSVTDSSIDVQTGSGVVHVGITRPLTTYMQIPSDLLHVTSTSYVGVASTEQADGKKKLGLKNVKAITRITYSAEEPRDYWAERGYSDYDGI